MGWVMIVTEGKDRGPAQTQRPTATVRMPAWTWLSKNSANGSSATGEEYGSWGKSGARVRRVSNVPIRSRRGRIALRVEPVSPRKVVPVGGVVSTCREPWARQSCVPDRSADASRGPALRNRPTTQAAASVTAAAPVGTKTPASCPTA